MQEENVDSKDDEKSPLEENSISSDAKDHDDLKENQKEEEKARVNDRRRFKSEEDSTEEDNDLLNPGLNDRSTLTNNSVKKGNLWNTNVSLSYTISAYNPEKINKTFWINTTSAFQVTKKWKVSYRARFNMIERDLVNHSFSIYRDLHCWELSLNWTPGGMGQGINLRINVKSPTLRDLKYEKKGGLYSRSPF